MNPVDKRIAEIEVRAKSIKGHGPFSDLLRRAISHEGLGGYPAEYSLFLSNCSEDVPYLLALVKKQREALEEIAKYWPPSEVPEPGDPDEAEMWQRIATGRKRMARKALAFNPDQEEAK